MLFLPSLSKFGKHRNGVRAWKAGAGGGVGVEAECWYWELCFEDRAKEGTAEVTRCARPGFVSGPRGRVVSKSTGSPSGFVAGRPD